MKSTINTLIIAFILALGAGVSASAQWRGSMTPYPVNRTPEAAPDTLEPIGVVHVARHGARYMTSDKDILTLRTKIAAHAEKHPVSEAAEKFSSILDTIEHVTANRWGMLDSVGATEEQVIAEKLCSDMGSALKHGSVEAWSTYVPRAIMSMYDFTYKMAMLSPYLNIQTYEGPRQDPLLRFFDTDSVYVEYLKNGAWTKVYKDYEKWMVPERPALAMLGTESGLTDKELRDLTMDMYNILRSTAAMGLNINPDPFFTSEELMSCWKTANLKHYLQRTATAVSDIPAQAAIPLLKTIIADVDRVADLRVPVRGMLYFAHAETLMPLFSLMNLPGCNAPDATVENVWQVWRDSDVVPLGANLDIEVWLDSEGTLLVSTVLNGQRQPAISGGDIFIPWSNLKEYWQNRLK